MQLLRPYIESISSCRELSWAEVKNHIKLVAPDLHDSLVSHVTVRMLSVQSAVLAAVHKFIAAVHKSITWAMQQALVRAPAW